MVGGVARIHVPAHIRCPLPMVKGVQRGSWSRLEMGWACDIVGLGVPPRILLKCHDEAARFVQLLMAPGSKGLVQEDFVPLLQDVVNTHPGLSFLKEAPEFHSRYITTVIQRIFYTVNRSWSGRITCTELRRSNFLQNVALLEVEPDINQLTEFFSYEHFYVIYCKFWELDTDHDLQVDAQDLGRHSDHAISSRMIDRIFSGAVTRDRKVQKDGKISYADFVWFLLSEEDKKTPTSIEYWFRCMDLDGDGVLSLYELEYFYKEQMQRLDARAIEPLPLEDCVCQMLDLVQPRIPGKITLPDLKRCKLAHVFFDTFFNVDKYLDYEQREQASLLRESDPDGPELSDWEKYAAEEYDFLVAEEVAGDSWDDGLLSELSPVEQKPWSLLAQRSIETLAPLGKVDLYACMDREHV